MTDSVFRTPVSEETPAPAPQVDSGPSSTGNVKVEIPDLLVSYEEDQGKPYVAKYFELENMWNREPSMARDLKEIEGYLKEQVQKGKLDNTTKAASSFIKEMERLAGLSRYESTNSRIAKLIAYIDFKRVVNG